MVLTTTYDVVTIKGNVWQKEKEVEMKQGKAEKSRANDKNVYF